MAYDGPVTRDAIRESLKTAYDKQSMTTRVLLADVDVGQVVTYGKKDTMRVSKTGLRPTVFNGRVNVNGHRFSIEAANTGSMLNKLAAEISRALRTDRKAAPMEAELETEAEAPAPTPKF